MSNDFIKILRVTGAFGIEGAVRVFLFTDQLNCYSKIFDKRGAPFSFRIKRPQKENKAIISLGGVSNRNVAESLKGEFFFINRDQLQQTNGDEFYLCNLIGKKVKVENTEIFCEIKSVQNYGAGDLIELNYGESNFLVPFTRENFPKMLNDDKKFYISENAFRTFITCSYKI